MEDLAVDACDEACSICLESFSELDPATVTVCNHEYHLQCIIEWSQRSRECPICWQSLALSDPISQELLAGVEVVRTARRRVSPIRHFTPFEEFELLNAPDQVSQGAEDFDIDDRIRQHIRAVAMSRAHHLSSRRESASALLNHSQLLLPVTPSDAQETFLPMGNQYSGGHSAVQGSISPVLNSFSPEGLPLELANPFHGIEHGTVHNRRGCSDHGIRASLVPPSSPQNPRISEFVSLSGSLKSKLSAASSRYKESFSKGTRSFKEKLLVHNNSLKEISKEVKREVTASIAGVARMMERLDLPSRRSGGVSPVSNCSQGSSKLPCNEDGQEGNLAIQSSVISDARKMPLCLNVPTQIHSSHP